MIRWESTSLGLRSEPQVLLPRGQRRDLVLRKELLCLLLRDRWDDHALAALLPVHRSGHLLGCGELEAVDHSDDLVKIPARGSGIQQRQLEPLVGADDEDSSAVITSSSQV